MMSLRTLCCVCALVYTGAVNIQTDSAKHVQSQVGEAYSGSISFTDRLALAAQLSNPLQRVAEHIGLMRSEPEAQSCLLPFGAKWCTARSGDKSWQMAVYDGSDPVSDSICKTGFWEHTDPKNMGVSSGDLLLDVGAHIGWYSFMFAMNGYSVLAIEPMTANRALITATMCRNPDLKITVVATALTDKVENPGQRCSIFSANINQGDGLLACGDEQIAELRDKAHNNEKIQHIEREQVPLTTLDEVLASYKPTHIDVMKMDVERYECHVLDGASTLFSRFHPKGLMIETRSSGNTNQGLKPGQIGSTTGCTVKAVMEGGNYQIHSDNIAGPVIQEPTGAGLFNLYFSSEQK